MPNTPGDQLIFLGPHADPDSMNESDGYNMDGELGKVFDRDDKRYQRVKLDSGATSDTSVGVVAANQVAYWKDKDSHIVTNDAPQAIGGQSANGYRNFVAGVFRSAITAGRHCCVLVKGDNIPLKDGGNTFAVGETVIAEGDATAAAFDRVAVGTAPTYKPVGIARGAASGGNVNVDVDIEPIP